MPDTRIPNVANLPAGPFQLTPGVAYDDYAASPVHRFYQMWQQLDCNTGYSNFWNPSGCRADLVPWVEVTVGAGANGKARPAPFTEETTREGGTAMGSYNVLQGDGPFLKFIKKNWYLDPLTKSSCDNLPNPKHERGNPYVPVNSPAIGDLMDLFDFNKK